MEKHSRYILPLLSLFVFLLLHVCVHGDESVEEEYEILTPGNQSDITYDGRSLMLGGKREFFFSGSVHYPRMPAVMWNDILNKCKDGGINLIQTYIFWNIHEPIKGQFNFEGDYDVVKFVKMVAEKGMFLTLRIGPFIQAEWNHGGLPYWLRAEKDIIFRTNNPVYKEHMEKWTTKVVNLMKENNLFAPQGGPIILAQIENEYDHVREAFKQDAMLYVQWAAQMAVKQNVGVPWIMCKSKDAPGEVINSCNGRHCGDTFSGPNAPTKPAIWTENWTAQYRVFGDAPSQRAAEDLAFSVARWWSKNGTHVNYYMYYGGTNYGRTAASFVTTRYYDEAPIDEFGLIREPKFGHLRDLHRALMLTKKAYFEGAYNVLEINPDLEVRYYEKGDLCSAFIWNNDTHNYQTVEFKGIKHSLPPKSISILPDCKSAVFNTDFVTCQHNAREFVKSESAHEKIKWEKTQEPLPTANDFHSVDPKEQFDVTKDTTDYLWYSTSVQLDNVDLPMKKSLRPVLQVLSLGHCLLAYVNGEFVGSAHGVKREYTFPFSAPVKLKEGLNKIVLLGCTVGMPDSGSYMEHRFTGIRSVEIQGLDTGNLDLTMNGWHHKIGLEGEKLKWFTEEGSKAAKWVAAKGDGEPMTWYRAYFDAPEGIEPLAVRVQNMSKGMVWVNGQGIGRYWSSFVTVNQRPSQSEYHIPRSYLKAKDNLVVILDEEGGNIDRVMIETVNRNVICSVIRESHLPSVWLWRRINGAIKPVMDNMKPQASLRCPAGMSIAKVDFASFGDPIGVCGLYLPGNCTAPNSLKVVEDACLGRQSCAIPADSTTFQDACPHLTPKTLAIQLRCAPKM